MSHLDKESLALVNDIFTLTRTAKEGVNALQYRANNDSKLELLDCLEREVFLRKENGQYRLSLAGLMLLDDDKKNKYLENFEMIFSKLKAFYRTNQTDSLKLSSLAELTGLHVDDVAGALFYMIEGPWWASHSNDLHSKEAYVRPSESILKYKTFYDAINQLHNWRNQPATNYGKRKYANRLVDRLRLKTKTKGVKMKARKSCKLPNRDIWKEIEKDYGMDKRAFGRKVNFVKNPFKRKVIFLDIEQAYFLACGGLSKPSVILAGGVIEEILRIYLEVKNVTPPRNSFDEYIKVCEQKGFFKAAIHSLTNSVRQFRNIVHLEKENSARVTLSKATAKGAVASIFTIVNDL